MKRGNGKEQVDQFPVRCLWLLTCRMETVLGYASDMTSLSSLFAQKSTTFHFCLLCLCPADPAHRYTKGNHAINTSSLHPSQSWTVTHW